MPRHWNQTDTDMDLSPICHMPYAVGKSFKPSKPQAPPLSDGDNKRIISNDNLRLKQGNKQSVWHSDDT